MSVHPAFVSGDVARNVFTWIDAVRALQLAYSRDQPASAIPPRTVAREGACWLRTLPAIPVGGRYYGAKLMGMDAASQTRGVDYVIVLFDRETSRLAAFVDGNVVTAYRTAATSAAAVDRMIGGEPVKLAVLGSGLEASMHTRAVAAIRPLAKVTVYSPTPESRAAFADLMSDELGLPVRAETSPELAVAGANLVIAAARSHGEKPILHGDWLDPRAAVVSIGSTVPDQREIDVSVIARSDIVVCDMVEEVLHETGDMIAATKAGVSVDGKTFGLFDLMAGRLDERLKDASAPLYKSVGGGLQDVVIAELILTRALDAGLTSSLPITFETKR